MPDTQPSTDATATGSSVIDRFAELEHLYRTAPVGLCLMDRDLRFLRINERLAAINGRVVEDHLGRTVREVIPEIADIVEPLYRRVIETGEVALNFEVAGETPAEPGVTKHWLVSYYPLTSSDGKVRAVSTVVQDITELKEAQDAMRSAGEELERRVVERTAELDEAREALARVCRVSMMQGLAGGLAHELNQPLTAIVNYAEAGRATIGRADAAAQLTDDFERIIEQAQRAAAIVRRVRLFVHKGEKVRTPTDVNQLVEETVPIIAVEARRSGPEIIIERAPELPAITLDPIQIQQVILNLARNGIEAMAKGAEPGSLTIRTAPVEDGVEITVRNTGPVIADEVAGRMFEAFYTTRPEGLGLGLAIARTIVEAHHGRLDMTGNDGAGVTFRFTLPATGPSAGGGDA
ncbi:MAG: PAS domain-containing protein [Planctomycetes bacterium]|nr:PAS domain-containing protein [Planctomycetota bacterium]